MARKTPKPKAVFLLKDPTLFIHDRLMEYQNSAYPKAVYGCIDTATTKLMWLHVWVTNSNPKIIGSCYLEYLYVTQVIPSMIRLSRDTETATMATTHAFLRGNHGDIYR